MKRFFQSEVGAAVIWMICSLGMAAVISPWVYRGGMWLAAMAEAGDLAAVLEWLGAACGRANFGRYFNRSLLFSALILLPLVFRRVKRLRSTGETGPLAANTRASWQTAAAWIAAGCIISGGMLWCMSAILDAVGALVPRARPPAPGMLFSKVLVPSVAASLVEECLFRGVLLGLWLRSTRPATACIGTSLLFAFLHFLQPPAGSPVVDPAQALAGFEILGKILLHFTGPLFFLTDYMPLLAVGLILAWARVRTGSLWFSIGLHTGWIMAYKSCNLFHQIIPDHFLIPWGLGGSPRSGLVPLLFLGITAVICHFVLRRFAPARHGC